MAVDTVKLTRMQRLGFAIETTTGTAATLSAATAAALVIDPSITPDQPGIALPNMAGLGNKHFLKGLAKATAGFSDYMTGIGAGCGVHDQFLLACGAVNAGGSYSFTNVAGGTATIGHYLDGLLQTGVGMVGNCIFTIKPGEPVLRKFDFQGAWGGETETALPGSVTDPTLIAPQCVSAVITIGGTAYTWDEMVIDLGNSIILRNSETSAAGIKAGLIVNRNPTLTISPEAVASSPFPALFGHATAQTAAFSAAISGGTGNSFTFAGTLALARYPGLKDGNGRVCHDLAFEFVNQSLTIAHT
jgi:hypothetical protein